MLNALQVRVISKDTSVEATEASAKLVLIEGKRMKGFITKQGIEFQHDFVLTWTMVGILAATTALGLATRFIFRMKPAVSFEAVRRSRNNKIEQLCERIILNESGIAVDLSPDVDGMDLTVTHYDESFGKVAKYESSKERVRGVKGS